MKTFSGLGKLIGKLNRYTCNLCGLGIVTIDRSAGVTPFTTSCKVTEGCRGHMVSAMYRVSQDLTPEWEWYRPTLATYAQLTKDQKDHVDQVGLLLRKIDPLRVETQPEYQPGQAKRDALSRVAGWRKGRR